MSVDMVKYIRLLFNLIANIKQDPNDPQIHHTLKQIETIQSNMDQIYRQPFNTKKWFVPKKTNDTVIRAISDYLQLQNRSYPLMEKILENHKFLTTQSTVWSQKFMRKSKRKTKSKKSCNNSRMNKSLRNKSRRNKSRRNRLRRSK